MRRARPGRRLALGAIRAYQLTLSGLIGRSCRHLPTCSDYTAEAIEHHGVWPGVWIGAARICRCGPGGTAGLDFVPDRLPTGASWRAPWRYGRWRGVNDTPPDADQSGAVTSTSTSSPLSTLNSRV